MSFMSYTAYGSITSMSPAKRRRVDTSTMAPAKRPRVGKFAMRVARSSRRKGSIAKQVASLTKIVKIDHKKISKATEYCDFSYNLGPGNPYFQTWASASLLAPVAWTATLRKGNLTDTSQEAKLLNMKVVLQLQHPAAEPRTIMWTFLWVSGKGDFNGTPRDGIDYIMQGPGTPVLINRTNIKIHNRFNIRTKARTLGDQISTSMPQRSFTMKINRWLKRTPTTAPANENNWKKLTAADFNAQEQIYLFVYADTAENATWTAAPTYSHHVTFSVSQM